MKAKTVSSAWMSRAGRRMDCSPYLSGAMEARVRLEEIPCEKQELSQLTAGHSGGIYNGPQFSRTFVSEPTHGVPFLGSASMLHSDLSNLRLLRRKDAQSPKLAYLRVAPGMTLISCSGTIGRMVYARPDMDGMWSSQDIMKVVPAPGKILPGYLYAYLNSRFGVPLVVSNTYGAIIQHIEPQHLADLPVPRLGQTVEQQVHDLVEEAAKLRARASAAISRSANEVTDLLGIPDIDDPNVASYGCTSVSASALNMRLDAPYHSLAAERAASALREGNAPVRPLPTVLKRYFKPPIFKRLWVEDPAYGRQFISGVDAYRYEAETVRYVSNKTPRFEEFVVKRGWIIFQAAGQIYGLFGQPLFVHGWLEELFCADDLYRLVPHDDTDGAFLYAFLRTPHGEALLKRQACGNSIPRVWDPHIRDMEVPWPDRAVRATIARPVIEAHERLEQALRSERAAVSMVEDTIEQAS